MEFTSWADRMASPETSRTAIRWLQDKAADATRKAFEIDANGNFAVDTIFIDATAPKA